MPDKICAYFLDMRAQDIMMKICQSTRMGSKRTSCKGESQCSVNEGDLHVDGRCFGLDGGYRNMLV